MNILIGTPAYNGLMHIDFVNSLLDFHKNKLPFSLMSIGNESLITRGRNTIISYFYNMKEFTHLLFLDSDIGISGADIIKLLSYNVDVIGAPVALKGFDKNGKKIYNVINAVKSKEIKLLYEVDKVGTAVFMMTRKATDALIHHATKKNDVYLSNTHTRGYNKFINMYDIFKTVVENGNYLSEDFYVCKLLKELGFTIFVDDTVKTMHNGMFQF